MNELIMAMINHHHRRWNRTLQPYKLIN